ncbi:ABC transporter substrate-binding protein [Paenibacillus eucommiae]|uniref:Multiple sugar transport system substrate-binding protein n=1 Tax=Paenibacillus eucommiae TaxID=1355755 RepID=A0ABS4ISV7_9BACL|nr:extracellular solute-binding protein [Paenibacillus eucommiae]MBP1990660.1 multiple sugar transport system substrate-binding protein [Paenibacillus eucommiae]
MMREKRKGLYLALVLTLVIALVTACGGGKQAPEETGSAGEKGNENKEEKVKIVLASYSLNDNNRINRLLERWNAKHPNIEVEYKDFPNDEKEYYKALDIALAGNETMDVIVVDYENSVQKGQQGVLLDVNPLAQKDNFDLAENFGPVMKDIQTDGKNYYLPYNIAFDVLWYNKDRFDEKKLTYPDENTTYPQLLELARQLTHGEGANKVYGLVLGYRAPSSALMPAESAGWNWVKEDGSPNFDDPRVKEALEWHKQLFDEDLAPTFVQMEIEKMNNRILLAQNKAAMIVRNWWTPVQWNMFRFNDKVFWQDGIDMKLGATFAPKINESAPSKVQNISAGYGYAVSAKSKHPDEAYQFVKFMATESYDILSVIPSYKKTDVSQFASLFNSFTDNDNVEHTDIYPQELIDQIKKVNDESISVKSALNPPVVDPSIRNALMDLLNRESSNYYSGKVQLNDFISKLQTEAEKIIKNLK